MTDVDDARANRVPEREEDWLSAGEMALLAQEAANSTAPSVGSSGDAPSRPTVVEVLAAHVEDCINSKERWTRCDCEAVVPWWVAEDVADWSGSFREHVAAALAAAGLVVSS